MDSILVNQPKISAAWWPFYLNSQPSKASHELHSPWTFHLVSEHGRRHVHSSEGSNEPLS